MTVESYNQIEVSREALRHNYCLLKKRCGKEVRLLAMVKADAYGHGMLDSAKAFSDAGCTDFGVAEPGEGVRLRMSGIEGNIFIFLGFTLTDVSLFFDYDLTPVLFDIEGAKALSREACYRNNEIVVHLKVDCGMTRLGIFPDQVDDFVQALENLPGLLFAGLASHFPKADEQGAVHTPEQFGRFDSLQVRLGQEQKLLRHTANSGAILYFPKTHCDMVRAGISLYGYYPDGICGIASETAEQLQPAMSFTTKVIQVKMVPAGVGVSYGHTFVTQTETTLAVLPIGYEDGFSRSLSNKAEVLIHGQRAKIRGRVCMNLCMVDVTHIQDVQVGDTVVILGSQGEDTISGDEIAGWMESISYEVLCLLGNNNERKNTT